MAAGVLAVWLFARWTDQLALTVELPDGGSVAVVSHPSAMVLGGIATMVTLTSVRSTEPRQHLVGMLRVAPMMVLGAVLGILVGGFIVIRLNMVLSISVTVRLNSMMKFPADHELLEIQSCHGAASLQVLIGFDDAR